MNWEITLFSVFILMIAVVLFFIKKRQDFAYHQRTSHATTCVPKVCIGIFHPYANGGGGGERVLYNALIALVEHFIQSTGSSPKKTLKAPKPTYSLQLILYSGDDEFSAEQLITNAANHFNLPRLIELRVAKYVQLVPLRQRDLLNPSQYPRLTLMWQGIAQFRLGLEAFRESRKRGLYPQFWLDTLGCPFSYLVAKGFGCTVIAYIHFPMISTDMIERVQNRESGITNEESIVASHSRSMLKYIYYRVFAVVYGVVGHFCSDITMVNSTWTHDHIQKLWGKPPLIVYPGCGSIQEYMKFDLRHRDQMVLSLSQFRPEKNHLLQLQSLKILLTDHAEEMASKFPEFKLVIIGSCPTKKSENLVMTLRKEAEKLDISDHVEFVVNASFADIKPYLERSSIGIHTMSNEHFGISNVEIMAAGIIHIANDSAGPKFDIIKPGTGILATTARTYAKTIWQVLNMTPTQLFQMRQAARESTWRFSDDEFNRKFLAVISTTVSNNY